MKNILRYLFEHKMLSRAYAKEIMLDLGKGKFNEHELSALMTIFLMRSISLPELQGFRDALIELAVPINFEERKVMDIVGTGGDGKNTFNISTLSCFIVAGAGQTVAKHGSYGSSSVSGASNVMGALGYVFKNDESLLRAEVDKTNMCFLHAPFFHPALKTVAPIRKNLGVRTFFNMLGPIVNPSSPTYQLIGVYNLEIARMYNYFLQGEDRKFAIIHSLDGYDEVSLTADVKYLSPAGEKIYTPEELGESLIDGTEIYGGESVEEASSIFMKILQGEGTPSQNAVVVANAAMALSLNDQFGDYQAAREAAKESLESGKAYMTLKKLLALQS